MLASPLLAMCPLGLPCILYVAICPLGLLIVLYVAMCPLGLPCVCYVCHVSFMFAMCPLC